MSGDLRRRVAYFGPREKVYAHDADSEVPGLPRDWRRVLSMSWPSPVAGPCGNLYADIEHALIAFRIHYTTNNPALAQLFRAEHEAFAGSRACRRWGTNNGLSLLLSDPDDRVWFIVRDRCMFDLVWQRLCRDEAYRHIVSVLVDLQYLPVYHVRTADQDTYWGAIIDRSKLNLTSSTSAENAAVDLGALSRERSTTWPDDPGSILVGKNRLGYIMRSAYIQHRALYGRGIPVRPKAIQLANDRLPVFPITPLVLPSAAPSSSPDSDPPPSKRPRTETEQLSPAASCVVAAGESIVEEVDRIIDNIVATGGDSLGLDCLESDEWSDLLE